MGSFPQTYNDPHTHTIQTSVEFGDFLELYYDALSLLMLNFAIFARPYFSGLLSRFQRANLRKGYNSFAIQAFS